MKFTETFLEGVFMIELEKIEDERGYFARIFDSKKFEVLGLSSKISQISISNNKIKGTIRGMHYQINPFEEDKIIHCIKGKIFDVIIDLRPKSKTFKKWIGVDLTSKNNKIIYIPKGMAHGFQTLENNTEIIYQISEFFMPKFANGVRWDDPAFKIKWPLKPTIISEKDRNYEFFNDKIIH